MPTLLALPPRGHGTLLLTSSLLLACNLAVYTSSTTETETTTGGTTAAATGGPTGSGPTSSGDPTDGGSAGTTTTTTGATTTTATTGPATTLETTTIGETTEGASTGDTSTTGTSSTGDTSTTTGGVDLGKMEEWGHPCTTDEDCQAIVGDGGVCLKDVLGLYGLPGGYCTKTCALPDVATKYVPDHPTCGAGVTCIGVKGFFEACVVECFDDSECPREGYECRILPEVGMAGDPMFCLMTDANKL